jgi:hypothetical protein
MEADKADGAGVRRSPGEEVGVTGEEIVEDREIAENDLAVAPGEFFTVAKSEGGKELAGRTAADGGVVLKLQAFFEE